jgi:hypothetical protein
MRLLLVCDVPIIVKIFTLMCKKLKIELVVQNHNEVQEKYDIIVLDTQFVDDKFNMIKQFAKKIGAISSEDLSFDKSRDFIIPRPFLPNMLQECLVEQMQLIEEEAKLQNARPATPQPTQRNQEDEELDLLAQYVAHDIEDENDESIVNLASFHQGGVLDRQELGKIKTMLETEPKVNEVHMNEEDWLDLSEIIDKALQEVKDYEFDMDAPQQDSIRLVLSKFTMDELTPLLLKLDQNSIDKLTTGGSINLELKLKEGD